MNQTFYNIFTNFCHDDLCKIKFVLNKDPMTSRVAPPKPRVARQLQLNDPYYNTRDYYVLTKERLDQIRQEKLYPFYDYDSEGRRGDLITEINDNSAQVQKQLNFLLPYYGFVFNYTWVSSCHISYFLISKYERGVTLFAI